MEEKVIIKSCKLPYLNNKIVLGLIAVGAVIIGLGDIFRYVALIVCSLLFMVLAILIACVAQTELTVTDKRVYGITSGGKRVDLPVDSISAVGTTYSNGISVSTSSGSLSFFGIQNNDEIHAEISKLLMLRQEKKSNAVNVVTAHQSSADELKKYKDLLDSGVITQEEFDAKKKQLLGL